MFVKAAKLLFFVITVSFLPFANAKETNIAIIDMQEIENKAHCVSDLVKKMQEYQKNIQTQIQAKSDSIQSQAKDLEKKSVNLSAAAIKDERTKLENALMNLQMEAQNKNEAMQKAKVSALADIDAKIRQIVADLAKSKNYDIVLTKQMMMFVNDKNFDDISASIISSLNSALKTVDFAKYINQSAKK